LAEPGATGGQAPGSRLHRLRGLKARLAFILGIVLVPALVYSCWLAYAAYADRQAQRAVAVSTILRVIAGYEADFFQRTRTLLLRLAAEPDVRGAERPTCSERLIEARNRSGDYLNFVVLGPDGQGLCSTAPELLVPLGDRAFFRQLERGASFVVSEVMPRQLGKGDTIVVAVPLAGPRAGTFAGGIAVSVNLDSFQRAIDSIELPPGGVAYLVDGRGRVLVQPARGKPEAREPPAPELLAQLRGNPQAAVTALGADGVRRDYHASEVAGGDLFVIAGIPAAARFAWLQHELLIGVFAPTLMLALAMITIWIASDYLVIRHVRTLGVAARAYSRGELDLRLDFASAPSEFQDLARTLARMAGRVRRREAELHASLAQKDVLLREVHHRVKNNLQIVTSLLNLRAQRLQAPEARDAVRQAQMRVAAMTLVHRRLYETDDIREIDLGGLLQDLGGMLEETNDGWRGAVEVHVAAEQPTAVPPDQAIPLALLVTEAVSNAFRHAFRPDLPGRIEVHLTRVGHAARVTVADDGVGLADGDRSSGGMGVTLMRMLAKQVGGTLVLADDRGTRIELEFPVVALEGEANLRARGVA
jgi:two-component sensor histidine kinase